MVEAFDALNQTNELQGWTILILWLTAGVLVEFVIRPWINRQMIRRGWFAGKVITSALAGQALFWFSLTGVLFASSELLPIGRLTELVRRGSSFLASLAVTLLVVRLLTSAVRIYVMQRQVGSVSLINNTMRILGGVVMLATAMALLNFPIGPLLTVIAGSSLGLSLALREPLANLFSGMTILASNKVRPGDYIRLSTGQEGFITDIRWSDTYVRELANNIVVVPNALLNNTILTNFHRPDPELAVLVDLGVSYESDLVRVERLVIAVAEEVMEEVPGGISSFEPFIRYNVFSETSVRFTVIMRGQSFTDQFMIRHEFFKRLTARFANEGLPPPQPVQIINLEQPRPQTERVSAPASAQRTGDASGKGLKEPSLQGEDDRD
ncbi:MAG: mechanosensitive ion channel family protein [Oscillochloridaceae bacterium umkhey_bin13]